MDKFKQTTFLLSATILTSSLILTSCTTSTTSHATSNQISKALSDESNNEILKEVIQLYQQQKLYAATTLLDERLRYYTQNMEKKDVQNFCTRNFTEQVIVAAKQKDGINAKIIPLYWADFFYFKGFIAFELGKTEESKQNLMKAIELCPMHAQYHNELAHVYQYEKNYEKALYHYSEAESFAKFSGPNSSLFLGRAKRGIGFVYIENKKYDEALIKYNECLEIDPNDQTAKNEIQYIKQLLKKENVE